MGRGSFHLDADSRVLLYQFGPFRLEPDERLLLRDGKPAVLTPKAFDLLVFLVQNQGSLLTKDEIMQAIWPGSFVEEANVAVLISTLRKVLGEREGADPYIKTVPKKGYRFTASVKVAEHTEVGPKSASGPAENPTTDYVQAEEYVPAEEAELRQNDIEATSTARVANNRSVRRNGVLIGAIVLAGAALAAAGYFTFRGSYASRTLAVIPLQNLRHDPDTEFLGFSLADAIISKLGLVSSVTVRPSSAIQKYKDRDIDIRRVAADLNVNTLLTGTYIREGDHLRITYQLVDVVPDKILCNDVIDLKYDELLMVHDNVSQQIIKGLRLNLTPSEAERIKPDAPIRPLAYEYYLRGVDLMASHRFPVAVKMLEKSVEIDPKYPLAWAYLGQSYTSDATFTLNGRESYRRAQAAYERALALDPRLMEAQMFLGNLLIDTGKVEEAVPILRDAIGRNANDAALHWELGYAYRFAGMLKQSVEECERARRIDPLVKSNGSVLNTYLYLGRYNDFLRSLPDVSESPFFRFYRGFGEYHEGKLDQAAADFIRAYDDEPTLYTGIGKAFADGIARKNSDGLQILRQLESRIQERGVGDPEATYKIGQAYAALGDRSSAIRAIRYSIDSGFFPYPYFEKDPLLDSLRNLPEFPRLLNAARQRNVAFEKKFF